METAVGDARHLLETLDRLEAAEAARSVQQARDVLLENELPRELVIFGSGVLGRMLFQSAQAAGIVVRAFADNDSSKWGNAIEGVRIVSPAEGVARFNETATFVIGIFNGLAPREQLSALGCTRIASYLQFAWTYPNATKFIPRVSSPLAILNHRTELLEAWGTLADDQSRAEFIGQIAWRCTLDNKRLPPRSDMPDIYFDQHIVNLGEAEVVLDCGAFDGDGIRSLLSIVGGFRRYFAFEPDPANLPYLTDYVNSLDKQLREKVEIVPFAVGALDESVPFDIGNGVGSGRRAGGSAKIESRRLDGLELGTPTFIKMDIEGMELEALRGAAETIRDSQPILAIAAYHYSEHLWQIPLLIRELSPKYDIVLRRYAEECWETVYYAVPRSRRAVAP